MSYILDALRKADAQRERDPARGIHAQPVRVAIGERRLRGGYRIGFWAASAAGLAALASVGWYLYRDSAAMPVPPPARIEVAVAAPAPAIVAPPAAAVLPPPVVVAPPVALPSPVVVAPRVAVPAPAGRQVESAPGIPVAGLPADAPKLAISGGVYSVNAAQRMLIVNGQVFNEGGEVGPGVVLEEIRPKAAVLRFRGSRYTVAY